jgi:S-adenosylmethionine:tRNA ribosyltransferase-isomerase
MTRKKTMLLSDFDYDLPPDLIARYPVAERSQSRLLCLQGETGAIAHKHFFDLPDLLDDKDLLVLNNTRVIPARLFGHKESGGRVEVLIDRILDAHRVMAHVRASKTLRAGSSILLGDYKLKVLGKHDDLYELSCEITPIFDILQAIGEIPLPPYMQRAAEDSDVERYQTVYAEQDGSAAAPTAGLHFDEQVFKRLAEKNIEIAYLTLHVGAGTFAPVRVENITEHKMHAEMIEVSAELCEQIKRTKARGGRIIAVGTTTARSLETASKSGDVQPFSGLTDIFIYPGFEFKCVDALITNFHIPSSTLLMLVSAFAGYEQVMAAYAEAIKEKYRFYSYGDAMWVTRS